MRTTSSRWFAGVITMALVLGPVQVVHAEPPGTTVDELFPYGQERFDAEDYGEAAEAWAKAVRLLPEDKKKKNSATRQTLVSLALDAYLRAYKAKDDRSFVDSAKTLLDDYEKSLQDTHGTVELTAEIADVKQKIDDAFKEIADKEAAEAEAKRLAEEANKPKPEPEPEPEPEGMKPGTGLIIGGAVLLGLGAGGIGLLAAGAAGSASAQKSYDAAMPGTPERDSAQKQGETMNALAITGAVIAPLFVGAGIALVIIGIKKNKTPKGAMLVPTFAPGYAGVGFSGRF